MIVWPDHEVSEVTSRMKWRSRGARCRGRLPIIIYRSSGIFYGTLVLETNFEME